MQLEARLTRLLAADGLDRVYSDARAATHPSAGRDGAAVSTSYHGVGRAVTARRGERLDPNWQIFALAGHPLNIDSPKQLSEVLFHELGLPVMKRNVKTGTASPRPMCSSSWRCRTALPGHARVAGAQKLKNTYVDALPSMTTRRPAASTPRSTRWSPPPAASAPATPTCKTSRSARRKAAKFARHSSPGRAAGSSSRPTTRKSSCASSRASLATRSVSSTPRHTPPPRHAPAKPPPVFGANRADSTRTNRAAKRR